MSNLSLAIDIQNRRLISSTASVIIPPLTVGDNINLSLRFQQAGPTGALVDTDQSAQSIVAGIGVVGGQPTEGSFSITFGANTATLIPFNATLTQMQSAITGLASVVSAGGAMVYAPEPGIYDVVFNSNGAQSAITANSTALFPSCSITILQNQVGSSISPSIQRIQLQVNPYTLQTSFTAQSAPAIPITRIQTGVTPVFAQQSITLTGSPTGGTFTFSSSTDSFTSGPVPFNASAAAFQALCGNIFTVTGTGPWVLTRINPGPISALTVNVSLLTGGTPGATVANVTTGVSGVNEIQSISLDPRAYSGSFAVSNTALGNTVTSPSILWNANSSTVQDALNSISNIGSVTVSGNQAGPYQVVWNSTGSQPLLVGVAGALIVPLTMNAQLLMNTLGIVDLVANDSSAAAIFSVKIVDGSGNSNTVFSTVVTINNTIFPGQLASSQPLYTYYSQAQVNLGFLQNKIGQIVAVGTGISGSLDYLSTAGALIAQYTVVMFVVSGNLNIWYLDVGTDANSSGTQRPVDYNASTNAVVWRRVL